MSQNAEITDGDTVSDKRLTLAEDTAMEISVMSFDKNFSTDEAMYDFRPQAVDAGRPDASPKDSSAVEPADSSKSKTDEDESSKEEQETIAPVEKVSGKPKA